MNHTHFEILKKLVSCESITPNDGNSIDYIADLLNSIGFCCQKLQYGDVTNLYAKIGDSSRNICFAGHVDVVPPHGNWATNPFELCENEGMLYGRGTNDMKGPLSSALFAIYDFVTNNHFDFSISVLLTSDEEVMTSDGMLSAVNFLQNQNEKITCCILCESCSPESAGEHIKTGCRGSMNIDLTSKGKQLHVVNSKDCGNHIHEFVACLAKLQAIDFDHGNEHFSPSNLEITSIDTANPTRNLIPAESCAKVNIRFNNEWSTNTMQQFIKQQLPNNIDVAFQTFGEAFVGASERLISFCSESIKQITKKKPTFGTSGGNSDALSIKKITDVVEIGSKLSGAHIANECISKKDLTKLYVIYLNIIKNFASF